MQLEACSLVFPNITLKVHFVPQIDALPYKEAHIGCKTAVGQESNFFPTEKH